MAPDEPSTQAHAGPGRGLSNQGYSEYGWVVQTAPGGGKYMSHHRKAEHDLGTWESELPTAHWSALLADSKSPLETLSLGAGHTR